MDPFRYQKSARIYPIARLPDWEDGKKRKGGLLNEDILTEEEKKKTLQRTEMKL